MISIISVCYYIKLCCCFVNCTEFNKGGKKIFHCNQRFISDKNQSVHSCFSRSVKSKAITMENGFQVTILDSKAPES